MENEQDAPLPFIKEALWAMRSNPHFAAAGIDDAFIDLFARNMRNFDNLGEGARTKIKDQFAEMALEQSYRTSVGQMTSEDKSRAMAEWFKGVNLLLVMSKKTTP